MSNPSTIWSQLSLPLSPIGSLPFVDIDGVSIITDVLNFFYTSGTATISQVGQLANQITVKNGMRIKLTDISAVPGNGVIATIAGRAAFIAGGAAAVVISGTPAVVGDIINVHKEFVDATLLTFVATVTAPGVITFTANAAATAKAVFSYSIQKVYV